MVFYSLEVTNTYLDNGQQVVCKRPEKAHDERWSPPWSPFEILGWICSFLGSCMSIYCIIYRCLHETTMSMYSTNIDAHSLSLYSSLFLMYIYSNPSKDSKKTIYHYSSRISYFSTLCFGLFFLQYPSLPLRSLPSCFAASPLGEPIRADAQRDAQEGGGGGSHQGSVICLSVQWLDFKRFNGVNNG